MRSRLGIHLVLLSLALLTLLPFFFMVNSAFKSNSEFLHSYVALPASVTGMVSLAWDAVRGADDRYRVQNAEGQEIEVDRKEALRHYWAVLGRGVAMAWAAIRPYMVNTLLVCALTALGVLCLGSGTAYILARYRFLGRNTIFLMIICTMMFPGVLTLVPSFLLVKSLGLLNSYWAMILPFVASGQVFAIFLFKTFFEGLPEDLFESARIDGAGHFRLYWNMVLPLSQPVFSVVLVMNILGTWNSFLWPLIVNPDGQHHMIASGLFVLANSAYAANAATMYAGYALSSIPLLILLAFATKPFVRGITSGAFKA